LSKFAIVFSSENKAVLDVIDSNGSSPYEKMVMGLAFSIRQHHADVDVYCGNFTNNRISQYAQNWFTNLNVQYVDDVVFDDIGNGAAAACFLRTFCKDYFAKRLLSQYDYLIYLDVDVILLKPIVFDFDPTGPMILTETMEEWVRNYHRSSLADLEGPLYFSWVDIINNHNKHIFDLDWNDPYSITEHNADVVVSNRIAKTDLQKIEQSIGSYNISKPVTERTIFHHYDSLGDEGSFYAIEDLYPDMYKKYKFMFEKILNTKIRNIKGYWEKISKEFQ
jgi:hypothetical protein